MCRAHAHLTPTVLKEGSGGFCQGPGLRRGRAGLGCWPGAQAGHGLASCLGCKQGAGCAVLGTHSVPSTISLHSQNPEVGLVFGHRQRRDRGSERLLTTRATRPSPQGSAARGVDAVSVVMAVAGRRQAAVGPGPALGPSLQPRFGVCEPCVSYTKWGQRNKLPAPHSL